MVLAANLRNMLALMLIVSFSFRLTTWGVEHSWYVSKIFTKSESASDIYSKSNVKNWKKYIY